MPPLGGPTEWLNSKPLGLAELRGHVVVVNFWTLTCTHQLPLGSPAIAGLTFQKGGLDSTLKGSPERHPALQTEPQREADDPRLPS